MMPLLGNVAEIQNFPTYHQDLSMERPATSRKESASTYPCRSLSGSIQVNGVDGVVLVVIQITDDPSAERTAPPRSTHVQPGDVSHALIQQGERERLGRLHPAAAQRRGDDGGAWQSCRASPSTYGRGGGVPGGREAPRA